jgi:CRISPR system Cascade subunit CasD
MPEIVAFRLDAPFAAWGDIAVGERRGTHVRPSHSAICGLVASSLGLPRSEPGHEALAAGFSLATRTEWLGVPFADFHTAQTPPERRGVRYATRADELRDPNKLGTIVSRRDYLGEVAFTVLLWPTASPSHSARALAEALNHPVFAPYAGRRSCPLGAPLAARVVTAETVVAAFAAYDALTEAHRTLAARLHPRARPHGEIAIDADLRDVCGAGIERQEFRRDRLVSRERWQFEPRAECILRRSVLKRETP